MQNLAKFKEWCTLCYLLFIVLLPDSTIHKLLVTNQPWMLYLITVCHLFLDMHLLLLSFLWLWIHSKWSVSPFQW